MRGEPRAVQQQGWERTFSMIGARRSAARGEGTVRSPMAREDRSAATPVAEQEFLFRSVMERMHEWQELREAKEFVKARVSRQRPQGNDALLASIQDMLEDFGLSDRIRRKASELLLQDRTNRAALASDNRVGHPMGKEDSFLSRIEQVAVFNDSEPSDRGSDLGERGRDGTSFDASMESFPSANFRSSLSKLSEVRGERKVAPSGPLARAYDAEVAMAGGRRETIHEQRYMWRGPGPPASAYLTGGGDFREVDGQMAPPKEMGGREAEDPCFDLMQTVADARRAWQRRIAERLNQLSAEARRPLARAEEEREPSEDGHLSAPSERIGRSGSETPHQPVYTAEDLMDAILCIRGGSSEERQGWGLIQVALDVPSLESLRKQFRELRLECPQVGLDDLFNARFSAKVLEEAENLAEHGRPMHARVFARQGVPAALRWHLWALSLGMPEPGRCGREYFEGLCRSVESRELLTDMLVHGAARSLVDDPRYFVFEETVRAVTLAFTRDASVPARCSLRPHPLVLGMGKSGKSHGPYPPSGVVPFPWLVLYLGPLCYLHQDAAAVYFLFRELYCRHLCRLHIISSGSRQGEMGLLGLCRMFEELLQSLRPHLVFHLLRLGCPPLRFAFPWILHAFSGFLEVDQVLLLWDRVIGFETLLPISLMAVAVLIFRERDIMEAENPSSVQTILEDFTEVRVVPLLQHLLFG